MDNFTETNETIIQVEQLPERYVVPFLFALIFIVGVLGNGTLVYIFIRNRTMRNVPNIYIISLALGDLLVLINCVPFTSMIYTLPEWPYGIFVCKLTESTKDVSIGVTVFTLTALSADRFFAIVDPMKKMYSSFGGHGSTTFTIFVASFIWVIAILLALPAAIASYLREVGSANGTSITICYPYPEEWGDAYQKGVVLAKFLIYYAIPLTIIACFYILMAYHLILSTKNMPGEQQGQGRQIRARKKVAKTVLAFVLVFAVCFLPQHVFMLWFYFYPNSQNNYNAFWHYFRILGFCLAFINSCVNPIALYCLSGTFRKYFDRYLLCWRGRKSHLGREDSYSAGPTRGYRGGTTSHIHLQHSTYRRRLSNSEPPTVLTTFTNGGSSAQDKLLV